MRANQLRLWFASFAYVLLEALRRIGLRHTQFVTASCGTIRLKLLKIGAQVRKSVRRINVAMSSAFPLPGRVPPRLPLPAPRRRLLNTPASRPCPRTAKTHHQHRKRALHQLLSYPKPPSTAKLPVAPTGCEAYLPGPWARRSARSLSRIRQPIGLDHDLPIVDARVAHLRRRVRRRDDPAAREADGDRAPLKSAPQIKLAWQESECSWRPTSAKTDDGTKTG
jgi:Transposase DDE domain group 1